MDGRTADGSNIVVGTVAPGLSIGTLELQELSEYGIVLGTDSTRATLEIDVDGATNDALVLTSMDDTLDLSSLDVSFVVQSFTPPGITNWFLESDGGVAGMLLARARR
jgi:hypothetical protein